MLPFFFIYPIANSTYLENYNYIWNSAAPSSKVNSRSHKERNACLLTFWRRGLYVEDLGSLNLRFLSIQGHAVLDHVVIIVHVNRDCSARRILRSSRRISEMKRLVRKIAVEISYRVQHTTWRSLWHCYKHGRTRNT